MNKKKIVALLVAGIMTIGVVGGTLAWFTSNDSVTNVFNTGATDDKTDPDAGIKVEEKFNYTEDNNGNRVYKENLMPGDIVDKEVKVTSTANYDQFVRAKVKMSFKRLVKDSNDGVLYQDVTHYRLDKDENNKIVGVEFGTNPNGDGWITLENKFKPIFATPGSEVGKSWTIKNNDGYYYYNQILESKKSTSNLLTDVQFVNDITEDNFNEDNYFKNITFDVLIEAESVQASNGAAGDLGWDTTVPAAGITGYKTQTESN